MEARNTQAGHAPAHAAPGADGRVAAPPDDRTDNVWSCAANGTWQRVPDPIDWQDGDNIERKLKESGYYEIHRYGAEDCGLWARIYEKCERGGFLADVWVGAAGYHVLLPGLPSAVIRF
jgi:hypothetical protein